MKFKRLQAMTVALETGDMNAARLLIIPPPIPTTTILQFLTVARALMAMIAG